MKTKKAMKKITHIGMAALVAMGMLGTSCNKVESQEMETPATPKDNIVTLTTTVGFAADDTKALTIDYTNKKLTKTFAVGEQVVLTYKDQDGNNQNTVSQALTPEDISANGKSAKLTFTLTNPKENGYISYQYPASGSSFYAQNGTLTDVATRDYATFDGNFDGTNLPTSATLENEIAVVAFTLYKSDGTTDITNTITGMTIEVSGVTYTITPSGLDKIYVAMWPEDGSEITITATDGSKNYTKTLTGKTYEAGEFYQQGLKMAEAPAATDLSTINANYTASDGEILTGTLASNVKISIADGATVTLNNVTINGVNDSHYVWAGITCLGDATIILSGTNTVKGFYENYPGIQPAAGKTLIINGTGSLTASSYGYAAAIGGGSGLACGNIEIQGGTITATSGGRGAGIGGGIHANCGNITISGGTVTATGGTNGAGIGGGYNASWGNITISGGTVTATGGQYGAGIGGGKRGNASFSCGNINISGGTVTATGGQEAAGIGGGRGNNDSYKSSCGTITITTGVTKVTATKGSGAPNSIGAGNIGTCDTVTIGGNVGAITTSPYTYPAVS